MTHLCLLRGTRVTGPLGLQRGSFTSEILEVRLVPESALQHLNIKTSLRNPIREGAWLTRYVSELIFPPFPSFPSQTSGCRGAEPWLLLDPTHLPALSELERRENQQQ